MVISFHGFREMDLFCFIREGREERKERISILMPGVVEFGVSSGVQLMLDRKGSRAILR